MLARLSRRAFLAGAAALPMVRLGVQPSALPADADVVVIGGVPDGPGFEPAALSAVYRLAQSPGLRVVLLEDQPRWMPEPPPPPPSPASATVAIGAQPPFVRGHELCFDKWRDAGNPGWGYADVLPSFKRLEHYEAGASASRGGDGPIPVAHCWDPHPAHRAFLMACSAGGFAQDSRHDFNGPRSQSVGGYFQKVHADDQPVSFTAALLDPLRANSGVTVSRGLMVTRLIFDGRRAVGVEVERGGERQTIRARRGVIMAASPIRAAQLLMLSGVGPAASLREVGVTIVADRPGVGANLHDQMMVPLRWKPLPAAGALPESTVTAGFFTVSLVASPPDLQMDFVVGASAVGLDITAVQPTSRDTMRLTSADPAKVPTVALNLLTTDADITALVQGVRLARLVGASSPLERYRGDESPDSAAARSTPELQAYVRSVAGRRRHLAGTCAMGPASDQTAVVDATLAVHGVTGLWAAGTSVMPTIVNAPPDAAALMIGERCAGFVLAAP